MTLLHRSLIAGGLQMAFLSGAWAQDAPECFSEVTKFNICQKAREIQTEMAPTLPMKMSANLTFLYVVAAGPRLMMTMIMPRTKAEWDRDVLLKTTPQEIAARVEQTTKNSVCSIDVTAAFVRLRGQIQYLYKTTDGYVLFSPLVTSCHGENNNR